MNDSLGTNEQILERLKSFSKPDDYPIEYTEAVRAHFAAIPGSKRDPTVREIFSLMTHIRETACNNLGARLGLPAGGWALLINARNQKGDQEISELREERAAAEEAIAECEAHLKGDGGSKDYEGMERMRQSSSFTSLPNTLPKMSPEETRDLIQTLRSQLGQDDHTPERYLLDALFELANFPPTTPESARDTLRRCQQIRECNQEVSKLREAQGGVRNQRESVDIQKKLAEARERVKASEKAEKELEEKMEKLLEAEHARVEADNKELAEMQERLDKAMEEREEIKEKIARFKAATAEMEEEVGNIQRTSAKTQAADDADEGKTKGSEQENGEAEGMASGSSD